MKKGVVFPAGRGLPWVADVGDEIELSAVARECGFEWCEIVRGGRLPKGFVMIVDEEGWLKPNEPNLVGCWFYGGPIPGTMMVLKEVWGPEGPELSGLTEDEVNAVFDAIGKEDDE